MNLYVPVAPLGGGVTAETSSGVCAGNGTSVFIPFVAEPAEKAAFIEVRARPPLITIVISASWFAVIVAGAVMVAFTPPPFAWQVLTQVWTTPL